jgi:hypothetical protein
MKALVAGWFSFEEMGATAGDLLARDVVCEWLRGAGFSYDVALASPFEGGVDWRTVTPSDYSHVCFVCGPLGNGWPITDFLPRFREQYLIGINLSMLESLETWNPFDLLIERDSSRAAHPDINFIARPAPVPVVGVVLVHPQTEYGDEAKHAVADAAIHRLIAARPMATVPIDTRLDSNRTGLRSPSEVESLIARMDVVLTTRLHGMVMALKHGVPAIAIDPIAGGAKILRQAEVVGWPRVFTTDTLSDGALQEAFDFCLTAGARDAANACSRGAETHLVALRTRVIETLKSATENRKGG